MLQLAHSFITELGAAPKARRAPTSTLDTDTQTHRIASWLLFSLCIFLRFGLCLVCRRLLSVPSQRSILLKAHQSQSLRNHLPFTSRAVRTSHRAPKVCVPPNLAGALAQTMLFCCPHTPVPVTSRSCNANTYQVNLLELS